MNPSPRKTVKAGKKVQRNAAPDVAAPRVPASRVATSDAVAPRAAASRAAAPREAAAGGEVYTASSDVARPKAKKSVAASRRVTPEQLAKAERKSAAKREAAARKQEREQQAASHFGPQPAPQAQQSSRGARQAASPQAVSPQAAVLTVGKHARAKRFDQPKGASEVARTARTVGPPGSAEPAESAEATANRPMRSKIIDFDRIKRDRRKQKAGKAFEKQFAGSSSGSTSDESEEGSRAAVYKGEMGRLHKRAADMQSAVAAVAGGGAMVGSTLGSVFGGLRRSRVFITGLGTVACVLAVSVFLYPSAQRCYVEMREYDRLQAEYAAVESRNAELEDQIDYLQSSEGIEARAREEFSWVKEGDESIAVYGLGSDDDGESNIARSVVSSDIKPPETWYSGILDPLFGVS